MKTNDRLDQKIDQLLASQPIQPPADFAARTLARATADAPGGKPGTLAPLFRFALPLAAALALAFSIFHAFEPKTAPRPSHSHAASTTLTNFDIQELLILQEGLSGFAQIESDEINSRELLDTLETLYSI